MTKLKLKNLDKKDKNLLLKWANLKSVIKNSLSREKIEITVHEKWFKKKINSKIDIIKIIMHGSIPIGVIRLEKKNKNYLISYLIIPKYRKKGNGYKALKMFLSILKKRNKPIKIFAIVKKDNNASIKIFDKLKFHLIKTQSKTITYNYNLD